ncbi:MAG: AAC(3)-I family aminoglycoside N-acetyltransferase [Bradyrhizobium sp.]|nr:MAG: AAC(3)-I family aminoglycoside N-acetyltransferase [Bradyrhizobium sp.]
MIIRRLGPGDIALMRLLNAMFGAAFNEAQAYRDQAPGDNHLRAALAKPHVIALAACESEAVVGGLVAYELNKLEKMSSEIYLYDLAVQAAQRRRGIATRLIAGLSDIARQRGASTIFVQADYGDEAAIALYQKLGAREDVIHFDITTPRRG